MNEELRLALLKEHSRDKRLTYIAYGLIVLIVVLLAVFLGKFILSIFDTDVLYPKIMLGVALLSYIIYAVIKIVRINKREGQIKEMLEKAKTGAKATNIVEYKEYKIIVPLGKTTYRMCPVEYHKFAFNDNPSKFYTIPVHPDYATDLKNLLSGADLEQINEKLNDLYSEKDIEYTNDNTPMKTIDEFKEMLKTELSETVGGIEESRKSSRKVMILMSVASVCVVVLYMGYMLFNAYTNQEGFSGVKMYIPIILLFVVFYAVYFIFLKPKVVKAFPDTQGGVARSAEFDFKTKVLNKIIKFISPDAEYVMHGHISVAELMESGMFRESNYEITGNDLIIGRYKGVPFQFCDLTVAVNKRITRENEEPDYALYGQYFVARFNKSFSSPVFIVPKTGIKGFFTGNEASVYTMYSGEKIKLEDPDFMKMFNVYGEDQIEARYILTPALMERIKELVNRTGGDYYISFYNNKITVANNSGKNNFELKSSKSITKDHYKILVEFYQDLCDQFAIINDLKLNIKIWR